MAEVMSKGAAKGMAERAARRTDGVTNVKNKLVVQQ
jgi:osmotically-inducible protein OsmY